MRSLLRPCCLLLAVLFVLTACQTSPEKPAPGVGHPSDYTLEQVPELLEQAAQAAPAKRPSQLLDVVEILLTHGETNWARNIITGLYSPNLADKVYARHQLLTGRLAMASGYRHDARRELTEPRLERLLPTLPPKLAIALREQRAQVFASVGQYRASIQERVTLGKLLAGLPTAIAAQHHLNQDVLWQTLMQLSHEELHHLQQQATNPTLQGWYSLASLSKNYQSNLSKQLAKVNEWASHWPEHPASLRLPADLQLLRNLVETRPQRVALLLPLTGELEQASVAIRDGFMAAFYAAAQNNEPLPDVRLYDTAAMGVDRAYDQAIIDGAQLVVGPLQKEAISELALRPELPVPTLALNYAETPYADFQRLYQFGLAVEDEARQVARRAWQDGHRRALIFAPVGEWGDRSVDAFWNEWQKLGGEVTRDYRYSGDKGYLGVVAAALHITDSKERAQRIRRIVGYPVRFEPRRRQDVDMIFLAAHTQQARQIKPTLAFHYAGNVPVYATSQVYSGEDPQTNQDMNGIRFTNLPWFYKENVPERQALHRYANDAISYQRLYALGADAYHLYPRLRQLREVGGARYYGYTGALSLGPAGKIRRKQTWVRFVNGKSRPVLTLSNNKNNDL